MFCVLELVVFPDPEESELFSDTDVAEATVHPDITLDDIDQGVEDAPKLFSSNRPNRISTRKRKAVVEEVDDVYNFDENGMSNFKLKCVKCPHSPHINLPREFKRLPI